ncbi:MAG: helix-turn-helix domain-containing protein [Candidatus Thermoplasmatota archaeon]|nr:helix-turn-helix domain-containing protein [Candidatus Thermoplasmatota archaeon]
MFEAVIDVNQKKCWIGKTLERFPISIEIIDTIPFHDTGVQDLVDIDLNGEQPEKIVEFVEKLEEVEFANTNRSSNGRRFKMIVGTNRCFGCRALAKTESFLLSVRSLKDGWAQWRVLIEMEEKLDELSELLNDIGIEHRVVDVTRFRSWETITASEELVLSSALERGYYEFPKRIGVRGLAKQMNVSTAYISYTLRSGQKKAIQKYFGIRDR